eukprot:jgi/Chrzof1/8280/Cz03g04110.t1
MECSSSSNSSSRPTCPVIRHSVSSNLFNPQPSFVAVCPTYQQQSDASAMHIPASIVYRHIVWHKQMQPAAFHT